MMGAGPAMMQMGRLEEEVINLKNDALQGKEPKGFRRLPYRSRDTSSTSITTKSDYP
jgi:hypothetical protein